MKTRFAIADPDNSLVSTFHMVAKETGPKVGYSAVPVSGADQKPFLIFLNRGSARAMAALMQAVAGGTFKVVEIGAGNAKHP